MGGAEPRSIESGLGHQEFTGEQIDRGEELKGNLKMGAYSAEVQQPGMGLE